ncbi:hypothetical protein F0562_019337 [Nyssa sinensis]|uniref:Uncharacterized protein n=1 Tax=Nyssa sinensis TaxID=561372 RepID=A0A5J4ZF61_9ASTE|nr:hypothetical protein F0562_019337 [Nyssa sinensis]
MTKSRDRRVTEAGSVAVKTESNLQLDVTLLTQQTHSNLDRKLTPSSSFSSSSLSPFSNSRGYELAKTSTPSLCIYDLKRLRWWTCY